MSGFRQRMVEELQVRRYSQRTQEGHMSWVSQLAQHYGKSPEQINSEEVRQFFVYLTKERQLSRSSVTTALSAVKFLYMEVLKQEGAEKKLPVVLSVEEVKRVLNEVRQPRYKVCLSTIYSCGLRLQEGTQREGVGVEPTDAGSTPPPTNFEDWGSHRATCLPADYCTRCRRDKQKARYSKAGNGVNMISDG